MGRKLYQTVIFDMDGVLTDSEPLHVQAEKETFASFGVTLKPSDLYRYMGRTPRILIQGIIEQYGLNIHADALYPRHSERLRNLYRSRAEPIPGALEFLRRCLRQGLKLGLASSSEMNLIRIVLQKFQLKDSFHAVTSGDEVGRVKPDPDIFLLTAKKLNCPPKRCAVIEDSGAGVRAAKAAGMFCVGFKGINSPEQDLSPADIQVDDFRSWDGYPLLSEGVR